MRQEHFGIAIVELMASGIVTIAHNSAGPRMDIIGTSPKPVGYLALTVEDYAWNIRRVLRKFDEHKEMRVEARKWVA